MKKFLYVIYLVVVCILVFFLADYIEFKILEKKFWQNIINSDLEKPSYFKYFDNEWFPFSITSYKKFYEKLCKEFRKDVLLDENAKSSIIVFGCSFAYGDKLDDKQTFEYKISKKTNRNVYNRAISACGIQHMYYLLLHSAFYNNLPKECEYVFFIYIPNHLQRLNKYVFPSEIDSNGAYLHYDIKKNELVLRKEITQLYKSFLFKRLMVEIDEKNYATNPNVREKNSELAIKLFVESRKLLQRRYPNMKFVILKYDIECDVDEQFENSRMWEELKKENFIVIKSEDLIGRKYKYNSEDTNQDGYHPSEAAWDLLVPKLVEELNL